MSDPNDIKNKVLERIRRGEVHMHSRAYFALRALGALALALLAFAATIFVLSFVLFAVHQSGVGFLLGYGGQGIATFLALLPWGLLVGALAALAVLGVVLRYFKVGYRFGVIEMLVVLVAGVLLASAALEYSPLHGMLLDAADHDSLPVIGPLYEHVHDSHRAEGVYRGIVSAVGTTTFTLSGSDQDRDSDDGTWVVLPPQGFDLAQVRVGERLYVAGSYDGTAVHAYGVSAYPPEPHRD